MPANDAGLGGVNSEQLAVFEPLSRLSRERLDEIAQTAKAVRAERGSDPLATCAATHSAYLLRGEIVLMFSQGGTLVVVGGTADANQALNRREKALARTKAITDVTLVLIEDDALDILSTWDQLAASLGKNGGASEANGRGVASAFSLANLRSGLFSRLPAAHIDELFRRFEHVTVKRKQVIVREGDQAEYYYVINTGRCLVERKIGGAEVKLAELRTGDAFGEEALVSEAKRNATVTAETDVELLRLDRAAFDSLLREPLLKRINFQDAARRVVAGAVWLDVRYPSEYQHDRLPGAINVPLSEVRNMVAVLDRGKQYIVYCQSGRRSAAAAFLFAQRGFDVWVLEAGMRSSQTGT